MKTLIGTTALLWASAVLADSGEVTFAQYEAVIEASATHADRCKREVRLDNIGERCAQFFEYVRSNTDVTRGFLERTEREGEVVFEGVSTSRMVAHRHYREKLTTDMLYITEMMQ